ncbi:ceramidase [Syncephalis fuscata]|nr:ceramidase [Syncephalis fuscata]
MHLYMMESLNATNHGYWGKRTANIEWCEENYAVCKYIAEFYNTTTNGLFILLALYGIYIAQKLKLEKRFALTFLSYMVIGIGSCGFHMTLLYELQLMDELPMVVTTSMLLYLMFDTDKMSQQRRRLLPLSLAAVSVFIMGTYLFVNDPLYYQFCYGVLTVITTLKSAQAFSRLTVHPATKQQLRRLFSVSWGAYGLGFLAWNIDNNFCSQLRATRVFIGEPWNGLLQLHAWWHLLTALGGYVFIVFCEYLRLCRLGKNNDYVLNWTMGILPTIVPRSEMKVKLI